MKEELFIIKDGRRVGIDLNIPSGITLKLNSNLFNDLSKIDCSKSYTFELPNTNANAEAFDMLGDIRRPSTFYGIKTPCEFWLDGVPIVTDGNLYISEIKEGQYSAVMTFGIITGLKEINDDDVSINELNQGEVTEYGWDASLRNEGSLGEYSAAEDFDNGQVMHPVFSAGVPYFSKTGGSISEKLYRMGNDEEPFYQRALPPPVVPVQMILAAISERYGLTFSDELVNTYDYDEWAQDIDNDAIADITKIGGIPLVSTKMGDEYAQLSYVHLQGFSRFSTITKTIQDRRGNSKTFDIDRVVLFTNLFVGNHQDTYFTSNGDGSFSTAMNKMQLVIDGRIYVYYNEVDELEEKPFLRLLSISYRGEREITKIDAEYNEPMSQQGRQVYYWDFRESEGFDKYTVETYVSKDVPMFFQISELPAGVIEADLTINPHFEEGIMGHKAMVFENLPDISCMTLLKSLYFMLGGFPKLTDDGKIGISFFTDLRKNLQNGDIYDWSAYVLFNYGEELQSLKFTNGNLARKNYYLMKNENPEEKSRITTEDMYFSPLFSIDCANMTLEKDKTIFQFPFYGKYMRDGKHHSMPTGETIKYWSIDKNYAVANESKPSFGLFGIDGNFLTWKVWQMDEGNEQYDLLQEILAKPYIVKIELRVPMFILTGLDYTKPVYIAQLNAFFAILSIETSLDGKCLAEFILLPLTEDYLPFHDQEVKRIIVNNFDTNGDGSISFAEASAITSIGTLFKQNQKLFTFNELMYFRVTEIEDSAFLGCIYLEEITLPYRMTTISRQAFSGCKALKTVFLPTTCTEIGPYAFADCWSFTGDMDLRHVTDIGVFAFLRTNIERYLLPNVPPTIPTNSYNQVFNDNSKFVVSSQSVKNTYLANPVWGQFGSSRFIVSS